MLNKATLETSNLPFSIYFEALGINTEENVFIPTNELLDLNLSSKNSMKKILILLGAVFLSIPGQAQNYIGIRSDIMSYSLKSQYGHKFNTGASYAAFYEFDYKPLISFGAEIGGYKFHFDDNKSTNIYVKPTVIFNGKIGHSTLAIFAGVSFDVSMSNKINNPTNYYPAPMGNTEAGITEKAYFYRSFGAVCGGFSYSYRIKRMDIGFRYETLGTQGGFYKGYESNFQRFGLFLKYKISKT